MYAAALVLGGGLVRGDLGGGLVTGPTSVKIHLGIPLF